MIRFTIELFVLPLDDSFYHRMIRVTIELFVWPLTHFQLVNGVIQYVHPQKTVTLDSAPVNDGQWHYVEARWLTDELILALDYGQIQVGGGTGRGRTLPSVGTGRGNSSFGIPLDNVDFSLISSNSLSIRIMFSSPLFYYHIACIVLYFIDYFQLLIH